jgi:hypothetical protein
MLSYLLARLNLTVSSLALVDIMKQNGLDLEHVSQDLTEIVQNDAWCKAFEESFLFDLSELILLSEFEYDLLTLREEFRILLDEIRHALKLHSVKQIGKIVSIHLQLPDTIIVEIFTVERTYATRHRRSRLLRNSFL